MDREQFLSFSSVVIDKVHIKEMNTDLFVRSLSAAEKATWEQQPYIDDPKAAIGMKISKDRMKTARERLVEMAACNEDGTAFFKAGDAARIGAMNAKIVSQLYDVATRLSGISKEDLEEVVRNSEGSQDDAYTSGSPTSTASQ